jgi:putative colanic acid biosynthesis acetyltransferase WcaF
MEKLESAVKLDQFNGFIGLNRGASKVKEAIWYLCKIFFFLSSFPFPSFVKCSLLRLFGAQVGNGVVVKPRVNIHFPWKLIVGNNVWIGEEVFILNFEVCAIGNNVCVSQRAFLCGGNHDYRMPAMPYRNGTITLKDGCWIGANVFVGPNVTIGVDTIITAGSTVTKSLEGNGIYKGTTIEYLGKRWKD